MIAAPPSAGRVPGVRDAAARDGERGSGTVLVLALVAAVLVVAAATGLLLGAQRAHERAQGAADLAALAGAAELRASDGALGPACAIARRSAAANRASVSGCLPGPGGSLRVRAVVHAVAGDATAEARAGPRAASGG
ncbi:Rv3654c family TadE-like protein [Cellulomonas alba]|uniref:Pilus assembly protein TadG-related protein n=1 Tax=Cellulomonas alba TaxID=3053467 RepID=A0ABT7SEJ9_9CELL|nr:Rv3654c family TadE-like protein [Cellulomonas alba]MDM7854464.1 pilus assembly protein TadG-related protein [Cellulomonas alba]